MTSAIKDNKTRGSAGAFLQQQITPDSNLSFVSAYFTTHAYYALKPQLDNIKRLRFLFGEPAFMTDNISGKIPKSYTLDSQTLTLSKTLSQKKIAKECHDWLLDKCDIRSMVKPNFLHGKAYYIQQANGTEEAIIGSSNFTVNGLGFGKTPNIELNITLNDKRDTKDLTNWFNEIWTNDTLTVDVKTELLTYLTELYRDNAPEFVYYFTLYHLFKDDLEQANRNDSVDIGTHLFDTEIWKTLFDFQKDGTKEIIKKIQHYGGCVLSDSVGLGKTYTALAAIKYFELKNYRVLVLAPKRLEQNWKLYLENSENNPLLNDRFRFDLYAHTDLDREKLAHIHWGNYDLVVIDESHNFKNHASSRYQFLMDKVIQKGIKTKVLLLSATPVNNSFKDLRNQLLLITSDKDSNFTEFGINSIEQTFKQAQGKLNEWVKSAERDKKSLFEKLGNELFSLLDAITIARSRSHIQQFYDIDFKFPIRNKPISIHSDLSTDEHFLSFKDIKERVDGYQLCIFSPSNYVKQLHLSDYKIIDTNNPKDENWDDQSTREHYLIGMMRVNFLKRLESSVYSFCSTLNRTINKIKLAIDKIDIFSQEKNKSQLLMDLDDENGFEFSQVSYLLEHLDLTRYKKDLIGDRNALEALLSKMQQITPEKDEKLRHLKNLIDEKSKQPNQKMLIFTAYSDTAAYLYDEVIKHTNLNCALVTGSGRNDATVGSKQFEPILQAFSPKSKKANPEQEIDILIATDCVSEGQNLQDCDLVINYDIHWNPVRIIQRFGRIDRIGSQNSSISMVNFWPTAELDEYLDLKDRVQTRMLLADMTATGSDNPLAQDEASEALLNWRVKQISDIQTGEFDFEASDNQTIALSDFSFNDLRTSLKQHLQGRENQYTETPTGIYAVLASESFEGSVFCLRALDDKGKNHQNPRYPYFLITVQDDGCIRYGYKSVKSTLELLAGLSVGATEPIIELCQVFDTQTECGENMQTIDAHINKAVASISNTGLRSGRNAVMIDDKKFELISWFVLKSQPTSL